MLRVALGRARSDREWCVNTSRAVDELKVSAMEFASNRTPTEAANEDEGPQMRRGRMMMSDANETRSMDSHFELEEGFRDLEDNSIYARA